MIPINETYESKIKCHFSFLSDLIVIPFRVAEMQNLALLSSPAYLNKDFSIITALLFPIGIRFLICMIHVITKI